MEASPLTVAEPTATILVRKKIANFTVLAFGKNALGPHHFVFTTPLVKPYDIATIVVSTETFAPLFLEVGFTRWRLGMMRDFATAGFVLRRIELHLYLSVKFSSRNIADDVPLRFGPCFDTKYTDELCEKPGHVTIKQHHEFSVSRNHALPPATSNRT